VAGFSDDPMSLYLKPGDEVECEIQNAGVLRDRVVAWADVHAGA
jgi:2-keto-4-pentenoate hydratase/2-oxohepta-3-ene-1,7-dioic acid hydratase in catechol pathway